MQNLFEQSLSKYVKPIDTPIDTAADKPAGKAPKTASSDTESEPEQKPKQKKPERVRDDPEKSKRTLFIGNLPASVMSKQSTQKLKVLLKSALKDSQKLESIRFRSIALKKPTQDHKMRKVSIHHSNNLHPDADTVNAYAVFNNPESVEQAIEQLNGQIFEERHLRLDHAEHKKSFENKRSIFVGNLPLNMTEEALWVYFDNVSKVEGVRVVRDGVANVGKGFAYVCFSSQDAVKQALKLSGKMSPAVGDKAGRPMRISTCVRKLKKSKQFEGQHASKNANRRLKSKPKK